MDSLFNEILVNVTDTLTFSSAAVTVLAALAFGAAIAFTYKKTQEERFYQRSLAITLLMLPIILSVIILFVGSNVARAFSLAGTLSIIRFRSAPGDAKDIGYIFFDIAAGLACGVGLFGYGAVFVAALCIVMFVVERKRLFAPKAAFKTLRITVPEDLDFSGAFDDVLKKYTEKYTLTKVKTADLGSLFQLSYDIALSDGANEKELIDELRVRNGNLTIVLAENERQAI